MTDVAQLLDHQTQADLRTVLHNNGFERLAELRDESLAALATLGYLPPELRPATLSILPGGVRDELHAQRAAERPGATPSRWVLTNEGERAASLLAAHVPEPDEDAEVAAERELAGMLDEVEDELGPLGNR